MAEGKKMTSYRDLDVWKRGVNLVTELYRLTSDFPNSELYGITNQIRRAAVSVPANIAEGWGRESSKNYVQFLRTSRGSLFELETLITIANNLDYLSPDQSSGIRKEIDELGRMLNTIIQKINTRINE
jgi:four helix bundle protein